MASNPDSLTEEHFNKIMKNVKERQNELLVPSKNEKTEIYKIVMNFIREKKRKVYGGYALNMLIKQFYPDKAIYDDDLTDPDVDIYTPNPIHDLKELSNIIYNSGYKPVYAKEAQHKDTFKIFVNFSKECCDISFVPNRVYEKIRFIEIDGIRYVHPYFMRIDMYRIFTDPLISYEQRLMKAYERCNLMDSIPEYKLPKFDFSKKKLIVEIYSDNRIYNVMRDVYENYLVDQEIIFTGLFTYNYYSQEYKKPNYIKVPYFELYSVKYTDDCHGILDYLSKYGEDITFDEYYPLFQFFGYSTCIMYKNTPIIYIYSNNSKCVPYVEVIAKTNEMNRSKSLNKYIKIGSYDQNILYMLICLVKVRIDSNNNANDVIYRYLNDLEHYKNYFFDRTGNTIESDTIFKRFVVNCMGKTIQSDRDKRLRDAINRMLKKNMEYRYDPSVKSSNKNNPYYLNIMTGEKIHDERHKRLNKSISELPIEEKYNIIYKTINEEKNEINKDLLDESNELVEEDEEEKVES